MKAYALVKGARKKVLAVSSDRTSLWRVGADHIRPGSGVLFYRQCKEICISNGMDIVPVQYAIGDKK